MRILNQPWDGRGQRVGDYLIELLLQTGQPFDAFRICVAYVKVSGMLRLAPALQVFRERSGQVEMIVGIDEGITSRQGLEMVLRYASRAYIFNNPATSFHPKLYLFDKPAVRAAAFIGSSNLTAGGLFTNYEINAGLELDLSVLADREVYQQLQAIFLKLTNPATGAEVTRQIISAFQPWEVFIMVLGRRDTQQQAGFSRDVYIPLAARDLNPDFWGWPDKFQLGRSKTVGRYRERRVNILARPVNNPAQWAADVRLYYYDIKHEFRLNCGLLVEGAKPDDLLVIQQMPSGSWLEGQRYEYEASVLSVAHPDYAAFLAECLHRVPHSRKRWGYL